MQESTFPKPKVHLFVCVNDRTTIPGMEKASCGPKINLQTVKEVKQWILQNGLATQVYCTKTKCLGFCHETGGTAVVYPSGKFFREVQSAEDLKQIIKEELARDL